MPVNIKLIRKLRLELDLTQAQAAKRGKFGSRQAWNNVESGRNSPTVDTLERVAKALGVKAADLLK